MKRVIAILAIFSSFLITSETSSPGDCAFNQGHHCNYRLIKQDWIWGTLNISNYQDHTINSTGGGFLSITDNENVSSTIARVFTPLREPTGPRKYCLTFWYRFLGKWIKSFKIIKDDDNANLESGIILWNVTEKTNLDWHYAQVPISSKDPYVIHFQAERFSNTIFDGSNNFVNVDDVIFTRGPCTIQPEYAVTNYTPSLPSKVIDELLPTPSSNSPINCTFDANNLCTWTQSKDNTMNWTLQTGPARLASYTGPKSDHTLRSDKGYYILIDVNSTNFGKAAGLESDFISEKDGKCLTFWYHMWGQNVNKLNLFFQVGNSRHLIWDRRRTQGIDWKRASVNLQMTETFKIVFEAIAHDSSSLCSIALDDISLSNMECPSSAYSCDFESSNCGYKSSIGNIWAVGSKHNSANLPLTIDHTFNTEFGHYIALNASQLEMFNTVDLKSPVLTLNVTKCLTFWYYIEISAKTELYVSTSYNENTIIFNSTSFNAYYGRWQMAQVTLNSTTNSMPKVIFSGMVMSNKDFIAIDDIEIRDGACPREGECNFEDRNLCTWMNTGNDIFDLWKLQTGDSTSIATGTINDHTLSNKDGTYLFIEKVMSQNQETRAQLYRLGFGQSAITTKCLHFWYNMTANANTSLRVDLLYVKNNITIWQFNGGQGYNKNKQWHYAQVSFASNKVPYGLAFEGVVDGSYGYIAIDDIVVTDNLCSTLPVEANVSIVHPDFKFPLPTKNLIQLIKCEFEYDTCNWTNAKSDEKWVINKFINKSSNYLPIEIFENYIYAQINHSQSRSKSDVKYTILSPFLTTDSADDQLCFMFDYFKFGSNKGDLTLYLELQENQTTISYRIWKSIEYSFEKWQTAHVQLNYPNAIFRFRLEAVINYAAVIAVKNLHLSTSKCMNKEICDFTNKCSWEPETNNGIPDWRIVQPSNLENGPAFDRTSNSYDGDFVYAQHDANTTLTRKRLLSPTFSNNGSQCLSFWYFFSDDKIHNLLIQLQYISNKNTNIYKTLWQTSYFNNYWIKGQVLIKDTKEFYIIFTAEFKGTISSSYIAVDDIRLQLGECEEYRACNFDNNFCGFTNVNNKWANWMVGHGITHQKRNIIRPKSDVNGNGLYAYVDYTYGIMPEESTTVLRSETISAYGGKKFCALFSFIINGYSEAKLQVFLSNKTIKGYKPLWEAKSDTKYTTWTKANVTFNANDNFEIIFTTYVMSVETFVAIDAVSIHELRDCPSAHDEKSTRDTEKYRCDFDPVDKCKFWNLTQHQNSAYDDWKVSNGLNSVLDGPNFDSTLNSKRGNYLVADNVKQARISSTKTIKLNDAICLQFWFNSYGETSNSLLVLLISENSRQQTAMYYTDIPSDGKWQKSHVHIKNKLNNKIVIQAEISKQNQTRGFIAIDDIVLTLSHCPGGCSFEQGMCGFTGDWTLALSSPFPLDHTTNTTKGYYLYSEESSSSSQYRYIQSPMIAAGKYCLSFWYIPAYPGVKLRVNRITSYTRTLSEIGTREYQRDKWNNHKINFDSTDQFQFSIGATGYEKGRYKVGLDDIVLSSGSCIGYF